MPWVRILSGSQTGAVVNQSETEAEINVSTGFAEYVKEGQSEVAAAPKPRTAHPPARGRRRAEEEDDEE